MTPEIQQMLANAVLASECAAKVIRHILSEDFEGAAKHADYACAISAGVQVEALALSTAIKEALDEKL